ncbi:Sphingosine-1-phosphate phosphatase 2, partial [Orchesella cincta]
MSHAETHAIVRAAVTLPIVIFTSSRYQKKRVDLVCLSRLYLGMHSMLNIPLGLGLVASLLPKVIPLADKLDSFFPTYEMGGVYLIGLGFFLCLSYPSSDRWTPARHLCHRQKRCRDEPRGLDKVPNGDPPWTSPFQPALRRDVAHLRDDLVGCNPTVFGSWSGAPFQNDGEKTRPFGSNEGLQKELDDDEGRSLAWHTLVGLSATYASPNWRGWEFRDLRSIQKPNRNRNQPP